MDATLMMSGWSVPLMMMFIPDSLITSCSCPLRSLMLPHFGMNVLISHPLPCMVSGIRLPMIDRVFSATYGAVSVLMKRTFLTCILTFDKMLLVDGYFS